MWTRLNTIRLRLTFWYILFLGVTLLGFSLYLYQELQHTLSLQIDAGLEAAASHLFVDVDNSVNPPLVRPMSESTEDYLVQSSFAMRLVNAEGEVIANVGNFPDIPFHQPGEEFENMMIEGVPWRIYTTQIEAEFAPTSAIWLQMGQTLNIVEDAQRSLLNLILFGLPVILIVTGLGGIFMANRALHPVDAITRTVQEINATDMTRRIDHPGSPDELGRLTETLNSMLERLQAAFDAQRRFTADASHELRTPLTVIKGQIGVTLTRPRDPAEYEATLHQIQQETDRLIRLANDLLFLARLDAAPLRWQPEPINLSEMLAALVDQMHLAAEAKNIQLQAVLAPAIEVQGMADHLIRLFLNLVDNAIKYTDPGGQITITLSATLESACVEIQDSGQGIAPEHLPYLFQRFYRLGKDRSQSNGAGLGLPIADQITQEHGGTIHIASTPGTGTQVTVCLPAK